MPGLTFSTSVYREVHKELFEGERRRQIGQDVQHFRHDWYLDKCKPLQWLVDEHPESYTIECTCLGVSLATGNYEFGVLLVVHDEAFWNNYSRTMQLSWESSKTTITVSSRDGQELAARLHNDPRPWAHRGLFAFVEGLRRLQQLDPSRVSLPDIQIMAP